MHAMPKTKLRVAVAVAALATGLVIPAASQASPTSAGAAGHVPRYRHIVVIMDNSEDFNSIFHYRFAPTINRLARQYGVASQYFTTSDPDVADTLDVLAGNNFGVDDHLPYWDEQIHGPSLLSQLDQAHLTWKEYVQDLPYPGYLGDCYPTLCQETDTLYKQQKFNGLPDLASVTDSPAEARKIVPDAELATDARTGRLPNFSFLVPSECADMHGGPPWCEDSSNTLHEPNGNKLIAAGDSYIAKVTREIMSGPQWRHGNNAIVLTLTEGDTNAGCCDVKTGTGHVLTVVITSHGPRHLVDATPFNHYSLLLTIEDAFGLHCLRHACDKVLAPMAKLFGAKSDQPANADAVARMMPQRPARPDAVPSAHPGPAVASPWKVIATPNTGPNDNDLAAIAGRSPKDIWAVGGLLPSANATIVQTLALHYNGAKWSRVPTPDVGTEANSLYGVAALPDGTAWATGIYTQNSGHTGRALAEHWNGHKWAVIPAANPGSTQDMLYSATGRSDSDVWAVGTYSGADGVFHPLIEHWNGHRWTAAHISGHAAADGILTSVASTGRGGVWAVGQLVSRAPDRQVILHLVGGSWKVASDSPVTSPRGGAASAYPQGIGGSPDGLWVAGNDRAGHAGFSTLVEAPGSAGHVIEVRSPDPTPQDNYLYGIALVNGGKQAWAVGNSVPVSTANAASLIEFGSATGGWKIVPSPNPGAANGSTFLNAVLAFSGTNVWAAGTFDGPGGERTLIMHYSGGRL
jgi:hypothetical protein